MRLQRTTWRIDATERERLDAVLAEGAPVLAAFWHGKYTPMYTLLSGYDACVFASDSFRGRVIAALCRRFGFQCVLVAAGAPEGAVGTMRAAMARSRLCATAADGPLGPGRSFKPRLMELAAEQSYRVLPLSVWCSRKRIMSGRWDQREIPLPFSKVKLRVGDSIELPWPLPLAEHETWQARLTRSIDALEGPTA